MQIPVIQPRLQNRLEVHDRKQFEIKLEYQPAPGADAEYLIEAFLFLPSSLNITAETYPRLDFYSDIHNYVRLKTPVLGFNDLLEAGNSPLRRLECWNAMGMPASEPEMIYEAKMLSCIFRGALRRFAALLAEHCEPASCQSLSHETVEAIERVIFSSGLHVGEVLKRFRLWMRQVGEKCPLEEGTKASLRLVDEYMSLSVEQFFRRSVADMTRLPQTAAVSEMRKQLLNEVIREETYRKESKLRSVLSPTGDNEEYMHRIGFLKKFCMNILFLHARRDQARRKWEEMLFALAAGFSMAFATLVAFVGQRRFPQASLNFSLILVVGYMLKDRIKEGLRQIFSKVASRHLFDRGTAISDPVTKACLGTCQEKVDYGTSFPVPPEVSKLRATDDFITVTQGELAEMHIRYQKKMVLHSDLLSRMPNGSTGVTDIIRLNVERLLRDMDDPELALEYVDAEDLTVGRVRGAKSYQVDIAFRFHIHESGKRTTSLQCVRLVLDRNGIKRMLRLNPEVSVRAA